jgi:hypothetical protein
VTPFDKACKETLRYLFSAYVKAPAVPYSIAPTVRKHNANPIEVSNFLLDSGFIRDLWIYQGADDVSCRITIKGIEEIDPAYVREKLKQLIGGLGESGGSKELLEILTYKLDEYSIAVDLVKQLELLGFVKVRHPKDQIIVELTEEGWKYYEKGSRSFFTLMSY